MSKQDHELWRLVSVSALIGAHLSAFEAGLFSSRPVVIPLLSILLYAWFRWVKKPEQKP